MSSARSIPSARASRTSSLAADRTIWHDSVRMLTSVGCVGVGDRDTACTAHTDASAHLRRSMLTWTSFGGDFDCDSLWTDAWGTSGRNGIARMSANIDFGRCICWWSSSR